MQVGVRLGAGTALEAHSQAMPMASLHADVRFVQGQYFLQVSPGLYLPGVDGTLSYGGLALELGGGASLSHGPLRPYVGAGVSGRLQYSYEFAAGFAPYAHLGLDYKFSPDMRVFVEGRAYQNVLPVTAGSRNVLPTEVGGAIGIVF